MNDRFDITRYNYTSVSKRGVATVDYIFVPYAHLEYIIDFSVTSASDAMLRHDIITRSWPVVCGSPSSRNFRTSWNRGCPPECGPGMRSRRGSHRQQSTVDTGWMLYRGTFSIMNAHDNACIVSQKNYSQKPWGKMNLMTHTKNSLIQYTMKWTKN